MKRLRLIEALEGKVVRERAPRMPNLEVQPYPGPNHPHMAPASVTPEVEIVYRTIIQASTTTENTSPAITVGKQRVGAMLARQLLGDLRDEVWALHDWAVRNGYTGELLDRTERLGKYVEGEHVEVMPE